MKNLDKKLEMLIIDIKHEACCDGEMRICEIIKERIMPLFKSKNDCKSQMKAELEMILAVFGGVR